MLCPLVHCFNLYSYTNLEKKSNNLIWSMSKFDELIERGS
jgi:hypothetical protein